MIETPVNETLIKNCEVYTNNPYHDTSGTNDLTPNGQFYSRLRIPVWICKKCISGYLPSLDRLLCSKPTFIPKCKAYSNIECNNCLPNFHKQKGLYQESMFNQKDTFDRVAFFNDFYQFGNNFVLNDPYKPYYINRHFEECKLDQSIDFCDEPLSAGFCQKCQLGYYLDQNFKCRQNPSDRILNCEIYESNNNCKKCSQNSFLTKTSTLTILTKNIDIFTCIPITKAQQIPDCLIHIKVSTVIYCSKCVKFNFLDSAIAASGQIPAHSRTCTPRINSRFVAGCFSYFSSEDKCEVCADGLALGSDGLICLDLVDKCLSYNIDKTGALTNPSGKFKFNYQLHFVLYVQRDSYFRVKNNSVYRI